jgi:hypothetical protein
MGVIGRLDDQVNDIIIKPVGERRGAAESEAKQTRVAETTPPPHATPEERAQEKESAEAASSELPVWLL